MYYARLSFYDLAKPCPGKRGTCIIRVGALRNTSLPFLRLDLSLLLLLFFEVLCLLPTLWTLLSVCECIAYAHSEGEFSCCTSFDV